MGLSGVDICCGKVGLVASVFFSVFVIQDELRETSNA